MNYRLNLMLALTVVATLISGACTQSPPPDYDVIIRGGTVYDGSGGEPYLADVGIIGDTIATIGDLTEKTGDIHLDARNMVVAPGIINMLSWATESLIEDGRAMSDIKQGVTLEIMGEGSSMGPLSAVMKESAQKRQGRIQFDIEWTTLGEYMDYLVDRGISPNVASYVGATTIRVHEVGYEDREPTAEELENMKELVREAMREGALGVGSSLIYAPASYASTDELIALVSAAAEYGGAYISHIRSEGNRLEEGVQELIKIASITGAPAEIYHLKAAGKSHWHKLMNVFDLIESAREIGLPISADMYSYTAGATGLDAAMPTWVQEGGHDAWVTALKDPETRTRVVREMDTRSDEWENLYLESGAENMILIDFKNRDLQKYTGRTLADVAAERGTSAADTIVDLVIEDDSRVGTAYIMMSEGNVKRKIAKDWISFGSDAGAPATGGVFLESNPHPRAYGNFARVLGQYTREESLLSLAEAIRRMTSLPASNTGIQKRGTLVAGHFADIIVFDPITIQDHATFDNPHQYATGMEHVLVNGVPVLKDGEHTGKKPGRVVRGPGWVGDEMETGE